MTDRAPEPTGARRPPTMADVADVAGVSHQTVSRVVNGSTAIRPATRERVLAAIADLGYRRNTAARALVTRRSGSIGVITTDMSQFGPARTLLGLESASRAAGYQLSLALMSEYTPAALVEAAEHLLTQAVEALVVVVAHPQTLPLLASLQPGLPVVAVGAGLTQMPLTAGIGQVEGADRATTHLLELGHESVAHLAGPGDWLESVARAQGWRQALRRAGRPEPVVLGEGDWSARSGYEIGRSLLRGPRPTAVFAANDQMALGLLRAIDEAGLRSPRDVSVVGFDDVPEAAFFTPPLTTVHQDFLELGRRAMDLIARALDGDATARTTSVEPVLVVRASTAAPAGTRFGHG